MPSDFRIRRAYCTGWFCSTNLPAAGGRIYRLLGWNMEGRYAYGVTLADHASFRRRKQLEKEYQGIDEYVARPRYRYANKPYCQLISVDISHLGDPFGTVIEGSIILTGPLCAIRTTGPEGGNSFLELSRGSLDCTDNVVSIMTSSIRWDDKDACLEGMNTQVYFLLIEESFGWCDGIVLRPMELGQGHYQRLGHVLARPSSLATLLGISRNPDLLERHRYPAVDPTHSFTIKIK
ncbi:uncharacterized protein PAC_16256 [Phialocephala subalpina]|uniref:Uncharacterized protein n=1 Tax=Phialocephala subalpina TaxID=576137 RepID=A0A1L7XMS7_9HELO|nr:uncharacterized protein PAC_16256 [Phialocephala subalpina]